MHDDLNDDLNHGADLNHDLNDGPDRDLNDGPDRDLNDDIARFIDELDDISGFERASTAVDGWDTDPDVTGIADWIESALIRCLRRQLAFPLDPPFGTAVIAGGQRERLYEQGPCETGGWFAERLQHEARAVHRPWVFVVAPRVAAFTSQMWQSWASYGNVTLTDGLDWYAEMRGRGERAQLWGRVTFDLEGGTLRLADHGTPPRPFSTILQGHPARRAEPIRSRSRW